jgi:mono/diheme cytochrome c family protein
MNGELFFCGVTVRSPMPAVLRVTKRFVRTVLFAVAIWAIPGGTPAHAAAVSGADVYKARCAACHDNPGATRAPSRDTLAKMPATRILRTLDFGLMMSVAYPLKREERDAVAKFLGSQETEAPLPPIASAALHGRLLDRTGAFALMARNSYTCERESTVSGILSSSVVAIMKTTWGGGSSMDFSSALNEWLESWCTSSMMNTL